MAVPRMPGRGVTTTLVKEKRIEEGSRDGALLRALLPRSVPSVALILDPTILYITRWSGCFNTVSQR